MGRKVPEILAGMDGRDQRAISALTAVAKKRGFGHVLHALDDYAWGPNTCDAERAQLRREAGPHNRLPDRFLALDAAAAALQSGILLRTYHPEQDQHPGVARSLATDPVYRRLYLRWSRTPSDPDYYRQAAARHLGHVVWYLAGAEAAGPAATQWPGQPGPAPPLPSLEAIDRVIIPPMPGTKAA